MNRRAFVLSSISTLLATSGASKACAEIPRFSQASSSKPYAASSLEQTDTKLFRISMLDQMRAAGIHLPTKYVPFQTQDKGNSWTDPVHNIVLGEPAKSATLDLMREYFNQDFADQPACQTLVLSKPYLAWRVFAALHETTHHVAFNCVTGGLDLNDHVFNAINRTSGQKAEKYVKKLEAIKNKSPSANEAFLKTALDPKQSVYVVALVSCRQIPERVADASAALYILSNYGATSANHAFLRNILDLRKACFEDIVHDTASSLESALDVFSKRSIHGLSIVQTTLWATETVRRQPEYAKSIAAIATDIRNQFVIKQGLLTRWRHSVYVGPEANTRQTVAHSIVDARNRACRFIPTNE
jgi:hypothetical protein